MAGPVKNQQHMKHFTNVESLSDLKRQYRALAIANHPDRGGDTAVMQEINQEFARLFAIWSIRNAGDVADDVTGGTAEGYTARAGIEYRWQGSNFTRTREYDAEKIFANVRAWLKETYPNIGFSVRKNSFDSYTVSLMHGNFWPYKNHDRLHGNINHHYVSQNEELSDRAKEIMENVIAYVESWNFDDSDIMTDYFHVNFYVHFEIGRYGKSYEYRDPMLKSSGPVFRRKVGPVEKKVREAIGAGNAFLAPKEYDQAKEEWYFDETVPKVLCKDDENHYPLWYSQPSLVKSRIAKLAAVGITAHATRRGIELVGYSDELTAALQAEKEAEDLREKEFLARLASKDKPGKNPETATMEISSDASGQPSVRIVEYSDKAIVVVGDTRPIAEKLKTLGGRFNARLSCGPGWIFSRRREADIRKSLGEALAA